MSFSCLDEWVFGACWWQFLFITSHFPIRGSCLGQTPMAWSLLSVFGNEGVFDSTQIHKLTGLLMVRQMIPFTSHAHVLCPPHKFFLQTQNTHCNKSVYCVVWKFVLWAFCFCTDFAWELHNLHTIVASQCFITQACCLREQTCLPPSLTVLVCDTSSSREMS